MNDFRSRLLLAIFSLLYSRLQLFHEVTGRALFGQAWHARRLHWIEHGGDYPTVVDVGAGEGRLIAECKKRSMPVLGIEPAFKMRMSARRGAVALLNGYSDDIPFASETVDLVVATYPGPWIFDDLTWNEFRRVLKPRGRVWVLLGGTYERGEWTCIRRLAFELAYGRSSGYTREDRLRYSDDFSLELREENDDWGRFYVLEGCRPAD